MTRGLGDINALIVNKLFRLGKPAYNKTKWSMLFLKRKMGSRRLRGGQAILGCRVAQSSRSGKRGSLVAKDLIDSDWLNCLKLSLGNSWVFCRLWYQKRCPTHSKNQWVTRSLIELPWTAKITDHSTTETTCFHTIYYNIWTKSHSKYVNYTVGVKRMPTCLELHYVTRAPLLYFIRSWVALSFKVVSLSVCQASVTPVRTSTFCNI